MRNVIIAHVASFHDEEAMDGMEGRRRWSGKMELF
jgi:hypothetical protein